MKPCRPPSNFRGTGTIFTSRMSASVLKTLLPIVFGIFISPEGRKQPVEGRQSGYWQAISWASHDLFGQVPARCRTMHWFIDQTCKKGGCPCGSLHGTFLFQFIQHLGGISGRHKMCDHKRRRNENLKALARYLKSTASCWFKNRTVPGGCVKALICLIGHSCWLNCVPFGLSIGFKSSITWKTCRKCLWFKQHKMF